MDGGPGISNKFLGDAEVAGLGTTFEDHDLGSSTPKGTWSSLQLRKHLMFR